MLSLDYMRTFYTTIERASKSIVLVKEDIVEMFHANMSLEAQMLHFHIFFYLSSACCCPLSVKSYQESFLPFSPIFQGPDKTSTPYLQNFLRSGINYSPDTATHNLTLQLARSKTMNILYSDPGSQVFVVGLKSRRVWNTVIGRIKKK